MVGVTHFLAPRRVSVGPSTTTKLFIDRSNLENGKKLRLNWRVHKFGAPWNKWFIREHLPQINAFEVSPVVTELDKTLDGTSRNRSKHVRSGRKLESMENSKSIPTGQGTILAEVLPSSCAIKVASNNDRLGLYFEPPYMLVKWDFHARDQGC